MCYANDAYCPADDRLGLLPAIPGGAIAFASIVSKASDIPIVGDILGGIFGGRKRYTKCPQQGEIEAALSQPELRHLVPRLAQLRGEMLPDGNPAPSTPAGVAFHAVGGSDCRITSTWGKQYYARVTDAINDAIQNIAVKREAAAPKPAPGAPPGAAPPPPRPAGAQLDVTKLLMVGGAAWLASRFL